MHAFRKAGLATWAIALVLVAWVFSQLPLAGITRAVASLSWMQWMVWIVLNLLIILVLTARWQRLIHALELRLALSSLLLLRQAGQVISFLTPGPQFGGEPFQVYWLWNRYAVPGHAAVLAVGMDRLYELWINFAVLLFGVLLLLTSPVVNYANWENIAAILAGMIALLSLLVWLALRRPGLLGSGIRRLAGRWQHHPRLARLDLHLERLGAGFSGASRHKPALFAAVLLSMAGWAGMIAEIWLLLEFLGIDAGTSGFILILVAMRLAFLLPLPGGIGTLEAAVLWAFSGLGLSVSAAAGLIALMRLRDGLVLFGGLLALRVLQSPWRVKSSPAVD